MHMCSRKTLSCAVFLSLIVALPLSSGGAELISFPSAQIQTTPAESADGKFRNSIQSLNCAELGKLKETLSEKGTASATSADRGYYARLIGIVSERAALITCPAR